MKAIIENNKTYKITGERGDFHITEDAYGKIKMFAKHKVETVDFTGFGKVFKAKKTKPMTKEQHARFMAKMNMSVLEDNFLPCQIQSGNYNIDLIR